MGRAQLVWCVGLVLASFAVHGGAAQGSDWPWFQGPARDGTSEETGLLKTWSEDGPPVTWTEAVGRGFGGVAVRDGEVFLLDRELSEKDVLRCLDLETGQEKWRHAYEAPGRQDYPGSRCVPAVTEDFVYTIGSFGHVLCVDRETHEVAWSVHLEEDFEGLMPGYGWVQSPVIFEDLVIVTALAEDIGLVALDRFTGETAWTSEGIGTTHSTPTLVVMNGVPLLLSVSAKGVSRGGRFMREDSRRGSGGRGFGGSRTPPSGGDAPARSGLNARYPDGVGVVAAFDARDGHTVWSTDEYFCWQPVTGPIKVDESRVFLTGGYRSGSALLEITEGPEGLQVTLGFRNQRGSHIHLPMLHEGYLFSLVNENFNTTARGRQKEGGLQCMDLEGNEVWRTGDEPFFGRGNALMADGVLIIQDGHSGILRLVEPSSQGYRPLAEANLFAIDDRKDHQMWAPMALSRGRLLLRSQELLQCVDLRQDPGTP